MLIISITSIGKQAFLACDNLGNISISSDNSHYTSENGVLFNKDKTELLYFPAGKTGSYTIPNTVVTIASEAKQTFRIYDLNGRLVHRSRSRQGAVTVDLNALSTGVYIVKDGKRTYKVKKQ